MLELRSSILGIIKCILVFGYTLAHPESCPSDKDIHPCTCSVYFSSAKVICEGLYEEVQLRHTIGGLKGRKISDLIVKDSNLGDVSGNLFKDTNISSIYFMNTTFHEHDKESKVSPFTGLENSLEYLGITQRFWDNEQSPMKPLHLSHLDKLTRLSLTGMIIPKLENEWFSDGPENLQYLSMISCHIKEVGNKAFSRLENLRGLTFTGNSVTLQKWMLPENAHYLVSIDISDNKIQEIPADFFQGMPALENVFVDHNDLTNIPQSTWGLILPQLYTIDFTSNPLICDSKLQWLFDSIIQDSVHGECSEPQRLAFREISSVGKEELD